MLINLFIKLQALFILKLISFKNLGRANSSAQFHYQSTNDACALPNWEMFDFLDAGAPPFFRGTVFQPIGYVFLVSSSFQIT